MFKRKLIAALIAAFGVIFIAQSSAFAGTCDYNSLNISSWPTGSHTSGPEPLNVSPPTSSQSFNPFGSFVLHQYVNPSLNDPVYHFTRISSPTSVQYKNTYMFWSGTLRIELDDPAKFKAVQVSLVHWNIPDLEWAFLDQNGNVLESGVNQNFPGSPVEGEKYTTSFNAFGMSSDAHYLELHGTGNELGLIQLCTQ